MGNLTTLAAALFGTDAVLPAKNIDDKPREQIAADIRNAGVPDALNRWAQDPPIQTTKEQGTEAMLSTTTETPSPVTKKAVATTAAKAADKAKAAKAADKAKAAKAPKAVKPGNKVVKVPAVAKAAKAPPKAPAKPVGKGAAGKPAKAPKAATAAGNPTTAGNRPDGLRSGSKLALLLDTAVAAGKAGATEAELCKSLGGWKACAVTLRRVCDRVGAKCERKNGKFVVTLKKAS